VHQAVVSLVAAAGQRYGVMDSLGGADPESSVKMLLIGAAVLLIGAGVLGTSGASFYLGR
jgi:hypothetical protein